MIRIQKSLSQEAKEYCGECGHHYDRHDFKEQTEGDAELVNNIYKMMTLETGRTRKTLEGGIISSLQDVLSSESNIPSKCLKDGCACEKFVTPEWDVTNNEIKKSIKKEKITHKHLGLKNNPCPCCVDEVTLRQSSTTRSFRKRESKKRVKREKEEKRQKTRLMNLKRYGHD